MLEWAKDSYLHSEITLKFVLIVISICLAFMACNTTEKIPEKRKPGGAEQPNVSASGLEEAKAQLKSDGCQKSSDCVLLGETNGCKAVCNSFKAYTAASVVSSKFIEISLGQCGLDTSCGLQMDPRAAVCKQSVCEIWQPAQALFPIDTRLSMSIKKSLKSGTQLYAFERFDQLKACVTADPKVIASGSMYIDDPHSEILFYDPVCKFEHGIVARGDLHDLTLRSGATVYSTVSSELPTPVCTVTSETSLGNSSVNQMNDLVVIDLNPPLTGCVPKRVVVRSVDFLGSSEFP